MLCISDGTDISSIDFLVLISVVDSAIVVILRWVCVVGVRVVI